MSEEGKSEHRKLLFHLTVEEMGSPGIVVNPDLAARTPCKCYAVDETEMCFSAGIIGTLSRPQVQAYCTAKEILREGGIVERVKKFKEAAAEAHKKIEALPKGERLEPWLSAMGEELRKRGIEI